MTKSRFDSPEMMEKVIFTVACQEGYFTVVRRDGRGKNQSKLFNDFASAAMDAFHDERALVYAVAIKDQSSTLVPRKKWGDYNRLARYIATQKELGML